MAIVRSHVPGVVLSWVASILLSEGSYQPPKPYGSGMRAVQETNHLYTALLVSHTPDIPQDDIGMYKFGLITFGPSYLRF